MTQAPKPSNVLLIQVDQMNHRCLSAAENTNLRTPALDGLIEQGTWFRQGRCNNPICLPSRVSMLSGMYPTSTKQFGFSGWCDSQTAWLPEVFRQRGCVTGAFGKLHAASIGWTEWPFDVTAPTLPEDQGFASGRDQSYCAYCQDQGVKYPHDQLHGHNPFGPGGYFPSSSHPGQFWMHRHSCESDVPSEHSLETWTTDRCLDFLRTRGADGKPFLAWLTYDRPHYPTTLPREWHEKALRRALTLPEGVDEDLLMLLPPSVRRDHESGTSLIRLGEERFRFIVATYYTLIEWIDAEIGRVLETLKTAGLDRDTTVVFTSDHGDEAGFRGLYDKINGVSSEEIVRVPLIIRPAPSLDCPASVSDSPAELVDLYPTVCELAGLPAPPAAEGVSLCPELRSSCGGRLRERPQICEENFSRSIVFGDSKLVFDLAASERQFYDLAKDPFCLINLYGQDAHLPAIAEGKRLLAAFLSTRIFGPYSERDIETVRRKMSAPPDEVGLCISDKTGLDAFRCAILARNSTHELFIPFYNDEMLLFTCAHDWTDNYRRAWDAEPMDWTAANAVLDEVLVKLFGWVPSLSLFRLPRETPAPSAAAAARIEEDAVLAAH
jgi:arylsulfatase A-like enzyme